MTKKAKVVTGVAVGALLVTISWGGGKLFPKEQPFTGDWRADAVSLYDKDSGKYEATGKLQEPVLLRFKEDGTFTFRDGRGEQTKGKVQWNGHGYDCKNYQRNVEWNAKEENGKLTLVSPDSVQIENRGKIVFTKVKKEDADKVMATKVLDQGSATQVIRSDMENTGRKCDITKMQIKNIRHYKDGYRFEAVYKEAVRMSYYVAYNENGKTLKDQWKINGRSWKRTKAEF